MKTSGQRSRGGMGELRAGTWVKQKNMKNMRILLGIVKGFLFSTMVKHNQTTIWDFFVFPSIVSKFKRLLGIFALVLHHDQKSSFMSNIVLAKKHGWTWQESDVRDLKCCTLHADEPKFCGQTF